MEVDSILHLVRVRILAYLKKQISLRRDDELPLDYLL